MSVLNLKHYPRTWQLFILYAFVINDVLNILLLFVFLSPKLYTLLEYKNHFT